MMTDRNTRRGFTLIELLIVVGIIVVLLVVLAITILPKLMAAKENNTRTLLTNVYGGISTQGTLRQEKFRRDAGNLSRKIESDEKISSSQMLLFYLAPSREVWDGSKLYAGQNYNPPNTQETYAEFLREETDKLPWLVDAWGTTIWYQEDRQAGVAYIRSAGPDGVWDNDDDLIFDPKSETIKLRSEMNRR
jgi:prepilin-type N-terminal cleavage/methylation domain-containing protein